MSICLIQFKLMQTIEESQDRLKIQKLYKAASIIGLHVYGNKMEYMILNR